MSLKKKIEDRDKELKYSTDRLGAGSLMTLSSLVNSSRQIMFNHHIGHAVNIEDPEYPLVSTGFENILSEYSTMIQRAESDLIVVNKIEKNKYNYILLVYDEANKRYDVIVRHELESHSEDFATKYKNGFIDSLEVGKRIDKGQMIRKSESFDKHGNYCLGKNLNTIYMISVDTMEDGIVLMNGADKMMNCYRLKTARIALNDNDIPINLYGDNKEYKAFPDIGEWIKDGIILATRRVDHSKSPYSLKSKYLRRTEEGDSIYYSTGKIIDITIYSNKDSSQLVESDTNRQMNEYYINQVEYYNTLYKVLSDVIDNAENEGYTYSDELTIIYKEAYNHMDASAYFTDLNENIFGNIMIEFSIMDKEPLVPGSKLVGRYGNKGVISKIYPPEESFKMESGEPVHVILDALGIVGRLNAGQLYEHSLNDLADIAVKKMKEESKIGDKFSILMDFMKTANKEQAKAMKEFYNRLNSDEKATFIKKIEKNGIFIVEDPIDNVDLLTIRKGYKKFPSQDQRIVFPDGSKSLKKIISAKHYFYRLKQDPIEKYSVRGRGPINPINLLPSKSNLKKKNLEEHSDVPVKVGTAEIDVLSLCNEPEAIADFMAIHSTSPTARIELAELYFTEVSEDFVLNEMSLGTKKNREMIDAYLNIFGNALIIEHGDPDEDNYLHKNKDKLTKLKWKDSAIKKLSLPDDEYDNDDDEDEEEFYNDDDEIYEDDEAINPDDDTDEEE